MTINTTAKTTTGINDNTRVLNYLITVAQEQRTTTYEELAQACDLPCHGNVMAMRLGLILTDIFEWCAANHWPVMTSLVVRKSGQDHGIPGKGFWVLAQRFENDPATMTWSPSLGALVDAPKSIRIAIAASYQIRCYSLFATLKARSNTDTMLEAHNA